jgi:hypothetical protein
VVDDKIEAANATQQAFNERQGVQLPRPLPVDNGVIPVGTVVDSHAIFLNTPRTTSVTDEDVVWTFDGPVLGVMSDADGKLEAASNAILGAPGTQYPGSCPNRGLEQEGQEGYSVLGNAIIVTMVASNSGDWIRVVTAHPPGKTLTVSSWGLAVLGLVLLVGAKLCHRHRRTVRE